jgi:hypothetical protein
MEKVATKKEIKNIHKRLLNGDHILLVNYGYLDKQILSCWYEEDSIGRYLRVLCIDEAFLVLPSQNFCTAKTTCVDYRENENIINYEPHNTELNFLEAGTLILEEDFLSQKDRKTLDYVNLLALTTPSYKNKFPYTKYREELNKSIA